MPCKDYNMIIVAAVALNGVIGKDGTIPWRLPSDLRHFKQYTMGKTIVMGRRTYESLPAGKLPGRDLIVLTKGGGMSRPQLRFAGSLKEATQMPRQSRHLIVAGGTEVYREALQYAHRMRITRVLARPDGDTLFPDFGDGWCSDSAPEQLSREAHDEYDTLLESWVQHL